MTTEEKAKAYDKVSKEVKEFFEGRQKMYSDVNQTLEYLFPKLKESEDDRIRKELMEFLVGKRVISNDLEGINIDKTLTWLKKQGEQKSIDDLNQQEAMDIAVAKCFEQGEQKPIIDGILTATNFDKIFQNCNVYKFKVGDWCIDNEDGVIFQIVKVLDNTYTYKTIEGKEYSCTRYSLENDARRWTIQDAKDGDVLLFEGYYNSIVLFQGIGINGKGRINYHCKCDLGNYSFGIQGDVAYLGTIEKDAEHYHPATKEQRDILFKKMKEAGYMWDAESKQILSLKAEPTREKGWRDEL